MMQVGLKTSYIVASWIEKTVTLLQVGLKTSRADHTSTLYRCTFWLQTQLFLHMDCNIVISYVY